VPEAVGFVPPGELGAYYERAAVVCCPSRREGYGVVAREAMAWGRPVVATAVGGLVDAIDNGDTGILVSAADAPSLRAAVAELAADSPRRERLGGAARVRARREFSIDAVLAALLRGYDDALRGRDVGA
jgi:glycosyltransferase involved in cell wall biosynthesis